MLRNIFYLFALVALFTAVLATPAPSELEVRSVPSVGELLEARGGHKSKSNSTTKATKSALNGTTNAATNSTSSGEKHKGANTADLSGAATNGTSTKTHKSKNGTSTATHENKKHNSTESGLAAAEAKSTASSTSSSSVATTTTSLGIRVEAWSTIAAGLLVAAGFSLL